jgi:hypothetical protein
MPSTSGSSFAAMPIAQLLLERLLLLLVQHAPAPKRELAKARADLRCGVGDTISPSCVTQAERDRVDRSWLIGRDIGAARDREQRFAVLRSGEQEQVAIRDQRDRAAGEAELADLVDEQYARRSVGVFGPGGPNARLKLLERCSPLPQIADRDLLEREPFSVQVGDPDVGTVTANDFMMLGVEVQVVHVARPLQ